MIVIVVVGKLIFSRILEVEEAEGVGEFVDEGFHEFVAAFLGELFGVEFDMAVPFGVGSGFLIEYFMLGIEDNFCGIVAIDHFVVDGGGPGVGCLLGGVDADVDVGVLFDDFSDELSGFFCFFLHPGVFGCVEAGSFGVGEY